MMRQAKEAEIPSQNDGQDSLHSSNTDQESRDLGDSSQFIDKFGPADQRLDAEDTESSESMGGVVKYDVYCQNGDSVDFNSLESQKSRESLGARYSE